MSASNEKILGSCHCRNVTYGLDWPQALEQITVRECSCSYCQKHGASYTSHPDSALNVTVADSTQINLYQFGHKTADFFVCTNCGCLLFAVCSMDGNDYAVINANNFDNVARETMTKIVTNFDEEDIEGRLARRKRKLDTFCRD